MYLAAKKLFILNKSFSMSDTNEKKSVKKSPSSKSMGSDTLKVVKRYPSTYSDNDSASTGSSEFGLSLQDSNFRKGETDVASGKKEKTKHLSKSLRKKFFHHFPNIEQDEEVLNRYSCALLSDILLQGSMYITTNYFGFYSNVFGYVTKLLIPILTVENITKEKTAKIFPNAIGIVTPDQKHVFGSIISRDSTLEYMRKIWEKAKSEAELLENELSEQGFDSTDFEADGDEINEVDEIDGIEHKEISYSENNQTQQDTRRRSRAILKVGKNITYFKKAAKRRIIMLATTALLITLYVSASLLLFRISQMQDKYSIVLQDMENLEQPGIYRDILEWQAQLQSKSNGAVYSYLDSNLEQIAKVKESLKALSSLLEDNTLSKEDISYLQEAAES